MDVTVLAFWRDMRERILWQPMPNSAFWSPINVGVSPALGSEIRAQGWGSSAVVKGLAWTWQLDYSLQRVWSALEQGKRTQWPFVPTHRWAAQGSLQKASWSVMGQVQGVSARNTLTDGSESLPAYALVTFAGSYEKSGHRLSLQIRNLTGTSYEEVPWFPRPGRSFHLTLYTSIPSSPFQKK
jgi:outer membrane cobalamin receptor